MALVRREQQLPQASAPKQKLVAVVDPALPAATPVQEMCAEAYQRLNPRLCALAAKELGDDGPDVVQDVFLNFFSKWSELEPDDRSDYAIVAAVKNRIVDVARRNRPSVELTDRLANDGRVPSLGPVEPDAVLSLEEVVGRFVPHLPPRCRRAYELVRDEEFTYEQAAYAMNVGIESVKTHLKRANGLIREALTDAGYRIEAGAVVKALPRSTGRSND